MVTEAGSSVNGGFAAFWRADIKSESAKSVVSTKSKIRVVPPEPSALEYATNYIYMCSLVIISLLHYQNQFIVNEQKKVPC